MFLPAKAHVLGAISGHVRGENKKNLNCQFFFLVGPNSSISEDSSTIEYSASALNSEIHIMNIKCTVLHEIWNILNSPTYIQQSLMPVTLKTS